MSSCQLNSLSFLSVHNGYRLTGFLSLKYAWHFNLRPYYLSIFQFISELQPSSPSDNAFNQITIVARSHIKFNFSLIFLDRLDDKLISKSYFPHKISVVIQLKGRFEFARSLHKKNLFLGRRRFQALRFVRNNLFVFFLLKCKKIAHVILLQKLAFLGEDWLLHFSKGYLFNWEIVFYVVTHFISDWLQHLFTVTTFPHHLHLHKRLY